MSVVISTVVLTAAVLGMGIAVMYWAQSMGKIANHEYSKAVTNNSNAVLERISFEHFSYTTSSQFSAYVINSGAVNVSIVRVFVWDSARNSKGTYNTETGTLTFTLIGGGAYPSNTIAVGSERCLQMTIPNLSTTETYTIRVVTQGGRNFDSTFSATL